MIKSEIKNILEKPVWALLIASTLFYLLGLFLFSHFVWSTDIYELNYTDQTGFEQYIDMIRRIDLLRYLFSPIYIFLISVLISILIKIGLSGHNIEIDNKLLFKIALIGTFILSLPLWGKSIWFVLIKENYTMEEVKSFYPMSILYFFDPQHLHIKMVKTLGRINLYHLAFMMFISWSLRSCTSSPFKQLFGIVLYTYGLGFLLVQLIYILIFI